MLSNEKIARINALSKKSKTKSLTDAEAQEQKELREEYIKTFRSSMVNTLHSVKVVDPNGNDVTPKKLKEEQNKRLH